MRCLHGRRRHPPPKPQRLPHAPHGRRVIEVTSGSKTLKDATNEAMRDWMGSVAHTHYIIGSVVGPHPFPMIVRDFQSSLAARPASNASKPKAVCRITSWPASAAAATPPESSPPSSPIHP
jgi:hypothetical protein